MLRLSAVRYAAFPVGSRTATTSAAQVNNVKPFSEVPRVRAIPLFGGGLNYLPYIGKYDVTRMHEAAQSKYKEYGNVVREDISKSFDFVQLFDVNDFEKVFRMEGKWPHRFTIECIKYYRDQRKEIYKSGGLFISNGEDWKEARTQVQTHMMKPRAVHAYLGAMDTVSKEMVKKTVHLRGGNGGEIPDYLAELYKWSLESVALVALDARLGCLDIQPNAEATNMIRVINEIFEQTLKLQFNFPFWKYWSTPLYKKFVHNMDVFADSCHKYLALAQKRLPTLPADHEATFLEMLLTTNKDPRHITSIVTDMFFAGIDTTSTTVGFTLYHLARNREAQDIAYNEVKDINEVLTSESLNNIRYLKACVKEAMRLTPVVIGTGRTLPEDAVLGGYAIPAGTNLLLHGLLAGWSEKNFTEPKKFKPERFLREEQVHDPFAFIPFGFGPRSCVGRRIAEQEIWSLLVRMLQRFRIEYQHGEIGLRTRLINTPDKPLRLQFYDR